MEPKCKAVVDAMDDQWLDSARRKSKRQHDKSSEMVHSTEIDQFFEEDELCCDSGIAE